MKCVAKKHVYDYIVFTSDNLNEVIAFIENADHTILYKDDSTIDFGLLGMSEGWRFVVGDYLVKHNRQSYSMLNVYSEETFKIIFESILI